MNLISLQLKFRAATVNTVPEAWFFWGNDPARWLEELARTGLANMETRLFVIPKSVTEREAVGLLVVPGRTDLGAESPAATTCRRIAGRLFLPSDATLYPPISDSEVQALNPMPVLFFHPVFGLSGFDNEAALRVSDLLARPVENNMVWNAARAGTNGLPGLRSIAVASPPSVATLFDDAKEQIGCDSPTELPPMEDEPSEGAVPSAARKLRLRLSALLSGILNRLRHPGQKRTWVNNLEDWLNRQLQTASPDLERERNKELHRLIEMLSRDPERGLRYAVPLNPWSAHRGIAPAGVRLGQRPADFNASRLGGRAADFWNIPNELREKLLKRYRELADREMRLGCYRRAAYIYAELLGDFHAAANVLAQGGYYREAAVIYEEHLGNPLLAARCLADAGLVEEAVERYKKLERWLDIADLYDKVGNHEEAGLAVEQAVGDLLRHDNTLAAARLIDQRLRNRERALQLLLGAWPLSRQAIECLAEALHIMGRLGRHQEVLKRVQELRRDAEPKGMEPRLVSMLTTAAREYPNDQVRHAAADVSRVIVAEQLTTWKPPIDTAVLLVTKLVELAPEDRLLTRDADRFLRGPKTVFTGPIRSDPGKLRVQKRFQLPKQIRWLQLKSEGAWFFALGVTRNHLTLLRGSWNGEFQSLSWTCPEPVGTSPLLFESTGPAASEIALVRPDGVSLEQKTFPVADEIFDRECRAGTPAMLPGQISKMAFSDYSIWTVHQVSDRIVLSSFNKVRGTLLQTIDLTAALEGLAGLVSVGSFCITALGPCIAIALGRRLVLCRRTGDFIREDLPDHSASIVATLPNIPQAIVVMLERGAVMYWFGMAHCLSLDSQLERPIGAFIPSGALVLVSGRQAALVDIASYRVRSTARITLDEPAVAVTAAANPGEFGVLGESGAITLYRVED